MTKVDPLSTSGPHSSCDEGGWGGRAVSAASRRRVEWLGREGSAVSARGARGALLCWPPHAPPLLLPLTSRHHQQPSTCPPPTAGRPPPARGGARDAACWRAGGGWRPPRPWLWPQPVPVCASVCATLGPGGRNGAGGVGGRLQGRRRIGTRWKLGLARRGGGGVGGRCVGGGEVVEKAQDCGRLPQKRECAKGSETGELLAVFSGASPSAATKHLGENVFVSVVAFSHFTFSFHLPTASRHEDTPTHPIHGAHECWH